MALVGVATAAARRGDRSQPALGPPAARVGGPAGEPPGRGDPASSLRHRSTGSPQPSPQTPAGEGGSAPSPGLWVPTVLHGAIARTCRWGPRTWVLALGLHPPNTPLLVWRVCVWWLLSPSSPHTLLARCSLPFTSRPEHICKTHHLPPRERTRHLSARSPETSPENLTGSNGAGSKRFTFLGRGGLGQGLIAGTQEERDFLQGEGSGSG